MADPLQRKPSHHSRTASRVFSGEAVVITPAENKVRMLNPVGSRIWELADGSRSVAEIVAVLTDEYEVDPARAQRTTVELLDTLAEKELIVWN
jgi:pyrroloquinoline quinone biosynthesis protein D